MSRPENLKQKWFSVASRLQSVSSTLNSNAIIKITIIVDSTGTPVAWTNPDIKTIEPRSQGLQWIRDILTD